MTVEQPEHIHVTLYREQIGKLETAVANNSDVDGVDELLQLLIADYTDTLDQLEPSSALRKEEVLSSLERQDVLLEDLKEEMDVDDDTDVESVYHLLEEILIEHERITDELEHCVIYY